MLKDFLNREWKSTCMGCQIANGETIPPGGILFKSKYFHINQDPLIPMRGFLVIGANRHIQKLTDLTNDEFLEYSNLIQITRKVITDIFKIELVTMVEEEFSCHFHTWFFPWSNEILNSNRPSLDLIRPLMNEAREKGVSKEEWTVIATDLDKAKGEIERMFNSE